MDQALTPEMLQQLNEQMYRQNAELLIRNKTLTILRHVSAQSLQSLDVPTVCQSVVNTITQELGVSVVLVSLYDVENKRMVHQSISQTPEVTQALTAFSNPEALMYVDVTTKNNLFVQSILEKKEIEITHVEQLLTTPVEESRAFQARLGLVEILILPIQGFGNDLGTLLLGFPKKVEELSTSERESLQQISQIVGLAIDRARLYEKSLKDNDKLRELDNLKDEFLSVASHDLRTPMTAMKGYLWLMLKKINQLPPDMAEKLRRIYNSSERMIALINDMLDVSRIESGRVKIVPETFDIGELARDVEQDLSGQADDEQLRLIITMPSILIRADRNRTHEVLVNLIGNALKFTPEGGSVTVSAEEKDGMVVTHVADTGIGIAPTDIGKLFGKFVRIDTSSTPVAQVPGTGLGLYICKKIIELSGGQITVQSEVGKGTVFTFSLPKG